MSFKQFTGFKRDYLAKEFLLEFLRDSSVKKKLILNDGARVDDPTADEDWDFEDLLVDRCITLADKLVSSLYGVNESGVNSQLQDLSDSSPLVFDGDLL